MLQEPLYQRNIEAVGIVGRKGVEFVSLKENIDTTTPQGRFMLTDSVRWQNWSGKTFWSGQRK